MIEDDDDDDDRDEEEAPGKKKAPKIRVLLSTCPPERAEELARHLVENRYAACVNVVPAVQSVYRWEGQVESQAECLLIVKCAKGATKAAAEALRARHPYKVPEIIWLTVKGGLPEYCEWVAANSAGR